MTAMLSRYKFPKQKNIKNNPTSTSQSLKMKRNKTITK